MFFNHGDIGDWRNILTTFGIAMVIAALISWWLIADENSRKRPPYWQQCVHVTTGESFTFHSSTAKKFQDGMQITDTDGWVRSINHETNADWKCREVAEADHEAE